MKKKIYQAFNSKIEAWVKYSFGEHGFRPLDVKEREPHIPFKGVPKRGRRR